jgi:predicted peptidase
VGQWWLPAQVGELLDSLAVQYRVDPERVYLTGLSMGGYGTWMTAIEYPERFAAIAPICGGGDPADVARIKHLPVWVFHGGRDTVVPLKNSEVMVEALQKAGNAVKFTVYPEAGHDSWTVTYDNPQLYEWFLKQRRAY